MTNLDPSDRILLSRDEVNAMLRIGDTTRQRLEKSDPAFPRKIRLSARRVAFRRADVLAYINSNGASL